MSEIPENSGKKEQGVVQLSTTLEGEAEKKK